MAIRFKDTISINEEYTFPSQDGTADQILATDGAGNISFVDVAGGEAVKIECKNTSGSTITKGTPVYVTGTVGTSFRVEVAPADASDSAKMPAVGLLETDLANNSEGYVVTGGLLKNLTTDPIDGTNTTSNDTIYVKAGGGLTMTKPTGSNLIQNIGKVGRVSSANSGSVVVSSILRTNDVPNLTEGKIWVGSANNTIESTVVHIDETNTRVGIGTNSPTVKLEINPSSGDADLILSSNGTQTLRLDQNSIRTTTTNDLTLFTNGNSNQLVLDSGGNIGIGTNSPANAKLQINTSSVGQDPIRAYNSSGVNTFELGHLSGDDPYLSMRTNAGVGEVLLRLDNGDSYINTGNIGIGTTSPSSKLEVVGEASHGTGFTQTRSGHPSFSLLNGGTNSVYLGIAPDGGTYNTFMQVVEDGTDIDYLRFNTGAGTERVRIDSSGRMGIGTNSPGEILHLSETGDTAKTRLRIDGGGKGFVIGKTNQSADYAHLKPRNSGSPAVLRVMANTASATSYLEVWATDYEADTSNFIRGMMYVDTSGNFRIRQDSSGTGAVGNLYLGTDSNADAVTILNNGRVGIGTTTPDDMLHVTGNITLEGGSPEITFETGATHYNWQLAAQENVNAAFDISVGSVDGDASNDTFTNVFTVYQASGGYTLSSGSSRAPIFYDSDDTTYYINPAGTSVQSFINIYSPTPHLAIEDSNNGAGGGAQGIITFRNTQGKAIGIGYTANETSNSDLIISTNAASTYGGYLGLDAGAILDTQADIILDPKTDVRVYGAIDMTNNDINNVNQLHFNDNVRFYDNGDDSYLNFKYGDTNNGAIVFRNGSDALKGYVYADSGSFGLLSNVGNWAVRIPNGGSGLELRSANNVEFTVNNDHTLSHGSSRAPIFYDSNDTNYYMDPSSISAAGLRTASGQLVSLYQASWTLGPSHYVLYNAWTSGTGDYLLVKGSGNQSGGNGAIIIGEGAVYYGQHGNAQAAIDSATAPLATNWGYLNSQGLHIGNDSNHYIGRNVTKTRIQSQYGYIDIGAGNSTYAHITTDRSYFYMDRTINFDGNILGYGGDETASFATYYDSNNTSYYINPADATSVRVAGFVDGGPNSAFRLFDGTDFRGGVGDGQWASGNASYTNDLAVYATANINFHTSNGNTPEMILTSSGLSIGSNIGAYIAEATGNYGTYRCEGVLGSSGTWAGWAIRDDWVFMSNGSAVAGIYNDTNNEWSVYCEQNARTILYYNGTAQVETQNGYLLAPNQMRAPIYYDSNDTTYYTNPAGDSYDLGLSRALAEVAGWVVAYGGYNENYAQWIETEDATQLYGYGDTSVGMVHRARRVKSGQTVRFTITLKSSVAVTSGLYLRLQVYNGNLPDGKTHVSNAATSSSPFVQEDSSQITSWYENGALGTSWQTEYFEYTATADCYISLLVLNWTGAGTARFYVKTPDIQTVGTPSGTTYTNLYYASDTNYGLVGNDAYFDTVDSGLTTDPLELVYTRGTEVRIGPNGGDKAIKASVFYEGTNTAYYCDPASTSRFVTTTTNYANITSGNAYAVRFWGGSHNYSIRMSTSADSTYGGRVAGETTSDYNMYFTMQAGTNRGFVFRSSNSSSSVVAGIDASGNGRFIGDVVAYSSSDERLKDNKKNIDNALEKVESLNGVEFDWNDKQDVYSGHDVGIIAQEVEKVLPEIVTDRENGYKAVKYEKLVPLLIEAVKELSEKVKMLENK